MYDHFEGRRGHSDTWDARDLFGFLMSDGAKNGRLFEALQSASVEVERRRLREKLEDCSVDGAAMARASLEPAYFVAKQLYLERKEHAYSLVRDAQGIETRH